MCRDSGIVIAPDYTGYLQLGSIDEKLPSLLIDDTVVFK